MKSAGSSSKNFFFTLKLVVLISLWTHALLSSDETSVGPWWQSLSDEFSFKPPTPGRNLIENPPDCSYALMALQYQELHDWGCPLCGNPFSMLITEPRPTVVVCIGCGTHVLPVEHSNEVARIFFKNERGQLEPRVLYAFPHPMEKDIETGESTLDDEFSEFLKDYSFAIKFLKAFAGPGEFRDFRTGKLFEGHSYLLMAEAKNFSAAKAIVNILGNHFAWLSFPKDFPQVDKMKGTGKRSPLLFISASENSLPQLNELVQIVERNGGRISWADIDDAREFKGKISNLHPLFQNPVSWERAQLFGEKMRGGLLLPPERGRQ